MIAYADDPNYSDVAVSNNKLVKRSNDDPDGYWPWKGPNVKMPDYRSTDTVGDTELISTFLERNKITDVTWRNKGVVSLLVMSCSCWIWVLTSQRCLKCLDMISMGVCDSYYDIKYIIYVYMSRYILEYIPNVSNRKWWNESEIFVIQHRNTKIICLFHPFYEFRIGK